MFNYVCVAVPGLCLFRILENRLRMIPIVTKEGFSPWLWSTTLLNNILTFGIDEEKIFPAQTLFWISSTWVVNCGLQTYSMPSPREDDSIFMVDGATFSNRHRSGILPRTWDLSDLGHWWLITFPRFSYFNHTFNTLLSKSISSLGITKIILESF